MYSLFLHTDRSRGHVASWSVVAIVLASCDPPTSAPREHVPAPTPASIQIVSGDDQSGVVGTDLALPLVAQLLDANGRSMRDQTVAFTVTGGGGVVTPSLVISDQGGVVQARWTLGTSSASAGLVQARVRSASGSSGPAVTFRATALPGAATTVRKLYGDAQYVEAGTPLAESLGVKVVDRFDNGVSDVAVHWTVVSGGGDVSPTTVVTKALGVARTRWTPSAAGSATVSAEVTAIAPVTFTATVTLPLVFASLSAGHDHTCGVTADGAAYCWGSNASGQLGTGSTTDSPTPAAVAGGVRFAAVSAGVFDTCGLTTGDNAYCWGGVYGPSPAPIGGGVRFRALSVGISHACGLEGDGAAFCWGENGLGELGTGDLTGSPTPAPVSGGLTFRSLSAGWYYTCGVTSDGVGYCWGADGALGYAATDPCQYDEPTNSLIACTQRPVLVEGGHRFAQVGTGEGFTCGLTTDGAAYCWGLYPERGSITPVAVPGALAFAALSVDAQRACGIAAGGSASCWGWIPVQNHFSNAPMPVPGGIPFATVSVGWFHTCGVTPSGAAYCWGDNSDGKLGDGSRANSLVPVKVSGPR